MMFAGMVTAMLALMSSGVWDAQWWCSDGAPVKFNMDPPPNLDVGQNGRPRGPQMWMSSLVLTIHNFGVPNFDPYPIDEV